MGFTAVGCIVVAVIDLYLKLSFLYCGAKVEQVAFEETPNLYELYKLMFELRSSIFVAHADLVAEHFHVSGIIAMVALAIRMVRVYLQQHNLQRAFARKRRVSAEALFDTKTSFILTWTGMRGIVSLAIALGLPVFLENGAPD